MIKVLEQINGKIDIKWIVIAILVVITLRGCFHDNKVPVLDNSVLTNRIDSLQKVTFDLKAQVKSAHDSINLNKAKIVTLYETKTKDSLIMAEMTISEKVNYFKDYVDTYSPIVDTEDTVTIDGSYIAGANYIFLDYDVKVKEVELLEENAKTMDLIEAKYNKQLDVAYKQSEVKLEVKQRDVDRLNKQVKKYRRQLVYYKIGSVAVVVGMILIAI